MDIPYIVSIPAPEGFFRGLLSNGVKGPLGPLRVQGGALALSSFTRLARETPPAPQLTAAPPRHTVIPSEGRPDRGLRYRHGKLLLWSTAARGPFEPDPGRTGVGTGNRVPPLLRPDTHSA